MMSNLLRKEFKLAVHPTSFIFLLLAPMLLIPNYPYYVAFFYQTLGVFFTFMNGNTTNDVTFTTLLPVRKRDAVKARVITVVVCELLQIVVSIPFAFLRNTLIPVPNAAGMEANAALFGLSLVMLGLFNLVFLPGFYKTAYKTGGPYVWACAAMSVFVILAELVIQLTPALKTALDTVNPAYLPQQMSVLAAGVVLFGILTALASKLSIERFEKLDL
jgi:hypothetical protein